MNTRKWLIILATLVLCIGLGITQASAAAPYVPVYTGNNNFTMLDPSGTAVGGTNDIQFTWDGTLKTSVAVSLQVSNATLASVTVTPTGLVACPFNGFTWKAHDVAVYGPGTYTVKASCAPKAPGCATGTNPITFTVGPDEIGAHILFDWGTVSTNKNIDVVNVWKKNSVFTPAAMWTGACGSNSASAMWELMSKDPGTGINGYPMVDGGFVGFRANFNLMGAPINRPVDTINNNFTMDQPDSIAFGGTNDVRFTWDGTQKTAVAASGQVSNGSVSSPCAFFGQPWFAHDLAVYGPGTYSVYTDCPAGSPGCGLGVAYTFTVNPGELGAHMLFFWNGNENIDVVDVWKAGSFDLGVDPAVCMPSEFWAGACLTGDPAQVWDHMSYDWDADCVNGSGMVDGPFQGMNANFNTMGLYIPVGCIPADCNDNNACTTDTCNTATSVCSNTPIVCNDNNACTTDTCNSATGCVFTPVVCNDNNACTTDTCNTATGVCGYAAKNCNDNNACTTDSCNTATGACVNTAIVCNDNNACTTDSCNTATGCVYTAAVCNDNNPCTTDTCNTATGCVYTPVVCNDNNACTTDSCNTANGACVYSAPKSCNDNNACTTDSCNTVTGACVNTAITCTDNNLCTTDTCNTSTGCSFAPIVCNDNNACTTDSCNTATGLCVYTAKNCGDNNACTTDTCNTSNGVCSNVVIVCNDNNACTTDTCNTASGCVFTPVVCNDNNACTTDTCNTSTGCVYTANAPCNDNNICTTDTCNTATGCVYTPTVPTSCNDNDACTVDTCSANACAHSARTTCPVGTCDAITGQCPGLCSDATTRCNDNNACTTDTCNTANGVCSNTAIVCNDNNICTADTCDTATGCVFTPTVPVSCNDNNACTTDTCANNACGHVAVVCNDNNACTTDSCNTATGACVYSAPKTCNDNNPCTTDSCNTATGACSNVAISCPAGQSCNSATGVCEILCTAASCNDNNVCTTDTCVANVCTHTANTTICPVSTGNNFTMIQPDNNIFGGTNDVVFAWDGTKKTAVAASGQVANATLSSTCAFFGVKWAAHDVAIYGPGTYTVASGCAAGSPGCGTGAPVTFTVKTGEIGVHMLFDWNGNFDIDVVNVMMPNTASSNMWTGACGSSLATDVWNWASYDFDGDGVNGTGMVDGPFVGMNANFNLMKQAPILCPPGKCDDNNACTTDSCNSATGVCSNVAIVCNDNNGCTNDTCVPATGCVFTPKNCDDSNMCTTDVCNPATGLCVNTAISCNDNNACTMDSCDPTTGCMHNPMPCNDNNVCTDDTCNTVTGCVYTPKVIDDGNKCTTDACNATTGVITHTAIVCNDNNACTTDTCNTATGCVYTAKVCDDNNACTTDACTPATGACVSTPKVIDDNNKCTTDACDPATGIVTHTLITCNDNNACTTDSCTPATGCVFAPKVCDDSNSCTTDSCDSATGACIWTPAADGTICPGGTCLSGSCNVTNMCPKGSRRAAKLIGTGQSWRVEKQIMTQFTVVGKTGCILRNTADTITVTPGTVLLVHFKQGKGPHAVYATWQGVVITNKASRTIVCPTTLGDVGQLYLSNTTNHGKDIDVLTITVATQ